MQPEQPGDHYCINYVVCQRIAYEGQINCHDCKENIKEIFYKPLPMRLKCVICKRMTDMHCYDSKTRHMCPDCFGDYVETGSYYRMKEKLECPEEYPDYVPPEYLTDCGGECLSIGETNEYTKYDGCEEDCKPVKCVNFEICGMTELPYIIMHNNRLCYRCHRTLYKLTIRKREPESCRVCHQTRTKFTHRGCGHYLCFTCFRKQNHIPNPESDPREPVQIDEFVSRARDLSLERYDEKTYGQSPCDICKYHPHIKDKTKYYSKAYLESLEQNEVAK